MSLPSTARQQLPVYPATRPSEQIDEDIIREAESALKAMRDYSEERESDNVFARLIIEEPEEFRGKLIFVFITYYTLNTYYVNSNYLT